VDVSAYRHRETITIERPADEIYDLLADVAKMGSWSPVCTGGRYDEDGEWFTGTNAIGDTTWETRCRVVAAERGKAFAFVNHGASGRHEMVRWGFELAPAKAGGDGSSSGRATSTEVTQSWEVLPAYEIGFGEEEDPGMTLEQRLDLMQVFALQGMPETLANIKAEAEGGAAAGSAG
jgi:hypothetical protein